jgi:hypothetical protein
MEGRKCRLSISCSVRSQMYEARKKTRLRDRRGREEGKG